MIGGLTVCVCIGVEIIGIEGVKGVNCTNGVDEIEGVDGIVGVTKGSMKKIRI